MTPAEVPSDNSTAYEIPRGRLEGFEDAPAAFSLPPRRTVSPSARPVLTSEAAATAPPQDSPAPSTDSEQPDPEPAARQAGGGAVRASNVNVPVALLEQLADTKRSTRMSTGEVIITAIEATYTRLQQQLRPPTPAGGALFAARTSKPTRGPLDGPVTPLNYRLTTDDFLTIDRLVRDLGASSRSHLISVALDLYFHPHP